MGVTGLVTELLNWLYLQNEEMEWFFAWGAQIPTN